MGIVCCRKVPCEVFGLPHRIGFCLADKLRIGCSFTLSQAILFEYDMLAASSTGRQTSLTRKNTSNRPSAVQKGVSSGSKPFSSSQQNLVSEMMELFSKARRTRGEAEERDDLTRLTQTLSGDLKGETGRGAVHERQAPVRMASKSLPRLSPTSPESGEDPKAKYMSRVSHAYIPRNDAIDGRRWRHARSSQERRKPKGSHSYH